MTITAIKEKYKDYEISGGEKNSFTVYDWQDGNGKVVIVVNVCKGYGKSVTQVVRVGDGIELLPRHSCRPCDNMDDAIDVAGEMIQDNGLEVPPLKE